MAYIAEQNIVSNVTFLHTRSFKCPRALPFVAQT